MAPRSSYLLILLCFLAACTTTPPPAPPPPAPAAAAPEKPRFSQTGTASWYGKSHQGKQTANGERFDMHKLTAAHPKLPFDTVVRVTNLENGKSVKVRITDRGPYEKGRIIDLSAAAAAALDIKEDGVAEVRIEAFDADQPQS